MSVECQRARMPPLPLPLGSSKLSVQRTYSRTSVRRRMSSRSRVSIVVRNLKSITMSRM